MKGCDIIVCNEIIESDHRGYLTDINFAECFVEEFVEGDERHERSLSPNRKSFREKFAEKCDQSLDNINIEKDRKEENSNFCRAKTEQTDADTTRMLSKATKCT